MPEERNGFGLETPTRPSTGNKARENDGIWDIGERATTTDGMRALRKHVGQGQDAGHPDNIPDLGGEE